MTRIPVWGALAILLLAVGPAVAQVKLKHKIADGANWKQDVRTEMAQKLTLAGMDLNSKNTTKMVLASQAGKRQDDGTIVVTSSIESLQTSMELPGGISLAYDSTKKDVEKPGTQLDGLIDALAAQVKHPWKVTYGADNRVISVTGRDKPLEGLDETTKALTKGQFSNANTKKATNSAIDQIPTKALRVGDSWQRTQDAALGGGQTMQFTSTYKYVGPVEQDGRTLHKLQFTSTKVSYTQDADSPTPLKLVKSDLKIAESNGLILFDLEKGQTVQSSEKVRITGDMKFSVNGMELDAKLDLTIDSKVETRK